MVRQFSIRYPRRHQARWLLRGIIGVLVRRLGDVEVEGLEHFPASGPVVVAANHFHFVDPPLLIYTNPRLTEFIGGAERPNAPWWAQQIPRLYGFIAAYRGGYGRATFRQSLDVLAQDGVLGIFPEGGSWANLLRPARPGLGYIAAKSGAPVLPVSIAGAERLLSRNQQPVKIIYHPPLPAPVINGPSAARREALAAFSSLVMERIASGLPDAQRGVFSSSAEARAAAAEVSDFPFDDPELRGR